jgi:hypothetical protein
MRNLFRLGMAQAKHAQECRCGPLRKIALAVADIDGRGKVIAPVPALGNLTLIDLGLPKNNPVASARAWNPALIGQYYFGTA